QRLGRRSGRHGARRCRLCAARNCPRIRRGMDDEPEEEALPARAGRGAVLPSRSGRAVRGTGGAMSALLAVLLLAATAGESRTVTLDECIKLGLEKNP